MFPEAVFPTFKKMQKKKTQKNSKQRMFLHIPEIQVFQTTFSYLYNFNVIIL